MKAMVLNAPRELALGDVARPAVGPGQVLVRVTHTGVCGTDLKIFSGAIPVRYPRIMGHEMIGEVADAGDSDALKVGDRVIVDPELFCGACFHCRIGQTHLCPKGQLLGRDANGGRGASGRDGIGGRGASGRVGSGGRDASGRVGSGGRGDAAPGV